MMYFTAIHTHQSPEPQQSSTHQILMWKGRELKKEYLNNAWHQNRFFFWGLFIISFSFARCRYLFLSIYLFIFGSCGTAVFFITLVVILFSFHFIIPAHLVAAETFWCSWHNEIARLSLRNRIDHVLRYKMRKEPQNSCWTLCRLQRRIKTETKQS